MTALHNRLAVVTFILILSRLLSNATAVSIDVTGICYGDYFEQILGGERKILLQTFECPECRGPREQSIGQYELFLISTGIHVFLNTSIVDFLHLNEHCSPEFMEISASSHNRVYVKCYSAAPEYNPQYHTFTLTEEGWIQNFVVLTVNGRNSYSNSSDNSVIVQAGQEDYIISLEKNSYQVILQQDSARTDPEILISLRQHCDKVFNLQKAPPFFSTEYSEEEPQVIVDCIKLGKEVRIAIPFDTEYFEVDVPNTRELHNVAGRLVSSDKNRLVFASNITITVVDQYNVNNLPLIKAFEHTIDNIDLLISDILLIEMDGEPLHLLNISAFQTSLTTDGITIIPDSIAYCNEGHCVAHAIDKGYLLTFKQHSTNDVYFETLLFDLFDGHSMMQTKLFQKTDISQICFFQVTEMIQSPTMNTFQTTYRPDAGSAHSLPWYMILALVIGVILLLLAILAIIVITLVLSHSRYHRKETIKRQSTELEQSAELVVPKSETCLFQVTNHSQHAVKYTITQDDITSDYSSKGGTDSNSLSSQSSSLVLPQHFVDTLEPVKQNDTSQGKMCIGCDNALQ